ncbi:MAG: hypothetical protein ABJO02_16595 [Reichenbachiella sp.]|uniref:hypothetical protein n=1 Tax=Reichenbachiella sp. TaxID=2184521 RepID=UPI0032985530
MRTLKKSISAQVLISGLKKSRHETRLPDELRLGPIREGDGNFFIDIVKLKDGSDEFTLNNLNVEGKCDLSFLPFETLNFRHCSFSDLRITSRTNTYLLNNSIDTLQISTQTNSTTHIDELVTDILIFRGYLKNIDTLALSKINRTNEKNTKVIIEARSFDTFLVENSNLETLSLQVRQQSINQAITLIGNGLSSLSFINLVNYGKIRLIGCNYLEFEQSQKSEHKLSIIDSNLGNIELLGCDLKDMTWESRHGVIKDMIYSNSELPKPNKASSSQFKELYQIYGQLSMVSQNSGDSFGMRKHLAISNHFLRKKMKHELNWSRFFSPDYLNLRISEFVSFFGQDWLKALRSILILVWLFPIAIILADDQVSLGIDVDFTLLTFKKYWSYLFDFIMPFHERNFLNVPKESMETTSYQWFLALDFASRLLFGYVIYHFIRSTRKFL